MGTVRNLANGWVWCIMDIGVAYKDLGKIDTSALTEFVANMPPEAWTQNTFRQEVLASKFHSASRSITLRHEWHQFAEPWKVRDLEDLVRPWAQNTGRDPATVMPHVIAQTDLGPIYEFPQWAEFAEVLQPIVDQVMALMKKTTAGVITRLALVELAPGAEIPPHIDGQRMAEKAHRLHVPLLNSAGVVYRIGKQKFSMKLGHVYDFNNRWRHSVQHEGKKPRTNLFFDYYPMTRMVYKSPLSV
jgi:hypothetical protein